VASFAELETKCLYFQTKGFDLIEKNQTKAVLRKDKELNPILVALGFLFFIIPLFIHLIYHGTRDKIHIVEIKLITY